MVPVTGCEGQTGGIHRALVGGAAAHRHAHVGGRFGRKSDREGVDPPLCNPGRTVALDDRQSHRIVVGGAHPQLGEAYGVVGAVAAAGRIHEDDVGLRTVVDVVVHAGNRHRLGAVPVGGRERQFGGTHRAFAGVVASHRHGDLCGRLAVQLDREGVGVARAGLGHLRGTAAMGDHQARRVVIVGGGDAHGNVLYDGVTSVVGVAGAIGIQDDVVGLRAVVDVVVDAGDGDRLIIIPVAGRERQHARTHRALVGGGAAHRHAHVVGRFGRQFDGEGRGTARLGRLAGYGPRRQPRLVVVGGGDAHGGVVQAFVIRVGARRVKDDVVGLRAVVHVVVRAGDRNRLRADPVDGGERQCGGSWRPLAVVVTAHRHRYVRGRFAVQFDREARGAAGLRRLAGYRTGRQPRLVVVGDRQRGARNRAHADAVLRHARHRNHATRALVKGVVHRRDRHRVVAAGGVARRNRDGVVRRRRHPVRPRQRRYRDGGLSGRGVTQGRRYRCRVARAALVDGGIRHRQGHRRRRLVVGDRQGYVHRIAHIATGGARYRHRATCPLVDAVVRRRDRHRRAAAGGGARRNRQHLVGTQRRPRIIGYRHCYRGRLGARGAQGRRHRGRIGRAALVDGVGRQGQGGGDVVVVVGYVHRDRLAAAVVVGVGAGRRQRQGVLDVAVYGAVVDAGNDDRLRLVPVAGGERQTDGGTQQALAGVQTGDRHRHLRRRRTRQFDRETVGGGGLRSPQCGLAHRQPGLVVGGGDAHGGAGQAVIIRVAAGRVEDDVVGLRAVGVVIVDAGNRHRLGTVPVGGRERQAGRIYRALAGVLAAHRHRDIGGRLGRQLDGERVGGGGLGHLCRPAALDDRQARRVIIGNGNYYRSGHALEARMS